MLLYRFTGAPNDSLRSREKPVVTDPLGVAPECATVYESAPSGAM